jgi:hypothetical protein
MRLILADSSSRSGLIAQLHQRRAQVAAHCAALKAASVQNDEKSLGWRLALDYGLALAMTELEWLDRELERILTQVPSMEAEAGD